MASCFPRSLTKGTWYEMWNYLWIKPKKLIEAAINKHKVNEIAAGRAWHESPSQKSSVEKMANREQMVVNRNDAHDVYFCTTTSFVEKVRDVRQKVRDVRQMAQRWAEWRGGAWHGGISCTGKQAAGTKRMKLERPAESWQDLREWQLADKLGRNSPTVLLPDSWWSG